MASSGKSKHTLLGALPAKEMIPTFSSCVTENCPGEGPGEEGECKDVQGWWRCTAVLWLWLDYLYARDF